MDEWTDGRSPDGRWSMVVSSNLSHDFQGFISLKFDQTYSWYFESDFTDLKFPVNFKVHILELIITTGFRLTVLPGSKTSGSRLLKNYKKYPCAHSRELWSTPHRVILIDGNVTFYIFKF